MSVIVSPRAEPVTVTEAKEHSRIDISADDGYVGGLLASARRYVEQYTRRALVTQQRELLLDCFPRCIELPVSPLQRVASIQYVDTQGATQTLSSVSYRVDTSSDVPRIVPAYGYNWPSTQPVINAVTVTYWAGYATPFTVDAGTDTLTAVNHPYANGDRVSLYNSGGDLPTGLDGIETYYAVGVSGNTLQLSTTEGGSAVDITNTGSGTHYAGIVPQELRHALMLTAAHWYEHREPVVVGMSVADVPLSVTALLNMKSVDRF